MGLVIARLVNDSLKLDCIHLFLLHTNRICTDFRIAFALLLRLSFALPSSSSLTLILTIDMVKV